MLMPPYLADDDWITELAGHEAYAGIDVRREVAKMKVWLTLPKNKGRKLTKRFVLNWLNKVDMPMTSTGTDPDQAQWPIRLMTCAKCTAPPKPGSRYCGRHG